MEREIIVKVHALGVDLAKNVFQLHGVDRKGRCILTRAPGQPHEAYWRAGAVPDRD